jgi:hypothetical protein
MTSFYGVLNAFSFSSFKKILFSLLPLGVLKLNDTENRETISYQAVCWNKLSMPLHIGLKTLKYLPGGFRVNGRVSVKRKA